MLLEPFHPYGATLQRACSALDAACAQGLQPTVGDASFDTLYPPNQLRAIILERQKVDLGFDAGPERFATFLALRLCRRFLEWLPQLMNAARQLAPPLSTVRHNFYLQPNTFPNDVDTTSVVAAALFEAGLCEIDQLRRSVTELYKALYIAENIQTSKYLPIPMNAQAIMVYWFDVINAPTFSRRPQFDSVVSSNALYAAYLAEAHGLTGAAQRFEHTRLQVVDHLASGRFRKGTFNYPSPDAFLCLFALVCASFSDRSGESVASDLARAISEREAEQFEDPIRDPSTALNLAQRTIAADALNVAFNRNLVSNVPHMKERLAALQGPDGLWPPGPLYSYGPLPYYGGSREMTTAYAISALGRGSLP